MKLKPFTFLLPVLAPVLVSCTLASSAGTPTVSFSVIASGDHTINGVPQNRKLEVYADQASCDSSLYLFIQPLTEHIVDSSS